MPTASVKSNRWRSMAIITAAAFVMIALFTVALVVYSNSIYESGISSGLLRLSDIAAQQTTALKSVLTQSQSLVNIAANNLAKFDSLDFTTNDESNAQIVETLEAACDYSAFKRVSAANTEGAVINSSGVVTTVTIRDFYNNALSGSSGITDSIVSQLDGSRVVLVYSPTYNYSRDITGVLFGTISADYFSSIIDGSAMNGMIDISIVQSDGASVYSNSKSPSGDLWQQLSEYAFEQSSWNEISRNVAQGYKGSACYKDGSDDGMLVCYQPLGVNGWYLVCRAPVSVIQPDIQGYLTPATYFAVASLGTLAVAIALFVIFAYKQRTQLDTIKALSATPNLGSFKLRLDDDLTLIHGSDAYYALHGYTRQEMADNLSNKARLLIAPDCEAAVRDILEHGALHKGENIDITIRILQKNNNTKWVYVWGAISEEYGTSYLCGCMLDVDEQMRIQTEYKLLSDSMPGGIIKSTSSSNGESITLLHVSDGFTSLVGYTREQIADIYDNEYLELIHPDDLFRFRKEFAALKDPAHGASSLEYRLITSTGDPIWVMERGQFVNDADGHEYYYCSITDTTALKQAEQDVKFANQAFKIAATLTSSVVFTLDLGKRQIELLSSEGFARYGYHQHRVNNIPDSLIQGGRIEGEYAALLYDCILKVMAGDESAECVIRAVDATDTPVWNQVRLVNVFDNEGMPIRVIGVIDDITERVEMQARINSEKQYRIATASETALSLDINLSQDTIISHYSNSTTNTAPKEGESFSDMYYRVMETIHDDDRIGYAKRFAPARLLKAYHSGVSEVKFECRFCPEGAPEGSWIWILCVIHMMSAVQSDDVIGFLYVRNITNEKQKESQLLQMAECDALTGLYNRAAMKYYVNRVLTESKELHALLLIDLDGFKSFNDTFGHMLGDTLLRSTADAFRRLFRSSDFICRLGGDEFMIFLKGTGSLSQVNGKANELCDAIRSLTVDDSVDKRISCSVGVCICTPDNDYTFDDMYQRADIALYEAKRAGRDRFVVYSDEA